MKRRLYVILLSIILAAGVRLYAQSGTGGTTNVTVPEKVKSHTFTTATSDNSINLIQAGIYEHRLVWTGSGTRTTCTIKLEQSIDNVAWTDLIAGQNCTANGSASASSYVNYVRITVTAITGASNTVYATYRGIPYGAPLGSVTGTVGIDQVTANANEVVVKAGSSIIGNVRIDQTTPGTTNGIVVNSASTDTILAGGLPAALAADGGLKVSSATAGAEHGVARTGPPVPIAGDEYDGTHKVEVPKVDANGNLYILPGTGGFTIGLPALAATSTLQTSSEAILTTIDADTGNMATSLGNLDNSVSGNYLAVKLSDSAGTGITSTTNWLDVNIKGGVTGDVAEGVAATQNPALIGLRAMTAEPTAVDTGDAIAARATLIGAPLNWGPALPGDTWQESVEVTGTAWTSLKALDANYYQCVTAIYVQNSDATVSTKFNVYDDDDGDIGGAVALWSGYAAALGGGGRMGDGNAPVFCTETVSQAIYFVAATDSSECQVTVRGFRTKLAQKF